VTNEWSGAVGPEQELEERLALAQPEDTVRGMFFHGTLELVRSVGGEEAVERCLEEAGERSFVPFFNYPVSEYMRVSREAARVLAPSCGGWEEAQRRLGSRAAEEFMRSAAGRALRLMAGGDVKRMWSHAGAAYRAAVSYGERLVVWETFTSGRLLMTRDFMPCAYQEGVIKGALEIGGARQVRVEGLRVAVLDSEYTFSWE
jgi:uncharacterized protein (TIGR02265 family)